MTKVEKKKAVLSVFFGKKVVSVRKDKKGSFITVTFEDGSTEQFGTETPEFKFWTEQISEEELTGSTTGTEASVTESSTEDEDFELEVEEVSSGKVKGQGK